MWVLEGGRHGSLPKKMRKNVILIQLRISIFDFLR